MEARLQEFCLNTQQIEQLIYRCEAQMTPKEQDTLRLRESYTDCTHILLEIIVRVGASQTEFQQLYKLVDLSYKKMIQVIHFFSERQQVAFDYPKHHLKVEEEDEEWMSVAFGGNQVDKNGNLVKGERVKRNKNIYQELESNEYNLIERLKHNTQEKIKSLNTHIVANQLKQLSNYFDHCKNNFTQFFIDQNKEIDEIWKKSKQDYEPTIQLMEIWKRKLQSQLDELRVKMSFLESDISTKVLEIKELKQKLERYNVESKEHGVQTPGLYDYRVLELNHKEKEIQSQSKRLYDLIFCYEGMLKEQFKTDVTKYNRIKEQMMRSMDKIKALELENIQMKQSLEREDGGIDRSLYSDETFELLKELRTMPAIQREMYNSAIVKFIDALKRLAKNCTTEEMVVALGLEGQVLDLRLDKKMFMTINEQEKEMVNQIQKRRSKISQFSLGKLHQGLDAIKQKVDLLDSTLTEEQFPTRSKNKRFNKMRSLQLKGKKITTTLNPKLQKVDPKLLSNDRIPSKDKKLSETPLYSTIKEQEFGSSNAWTQSTKRQLTIKDLEMGVSEEVWMNQSKQSSKHSLRGTNRVTKQSISSPKQSMSRESSRQKISLKVFQKKSSTGKVTPNHIIMEQPGWENIRTDPIRVEVGQQVFQQAKTAGVQTETLRVQCLFCGNQSPLIITEQTKANTQGETPSAQNMCLKQLNVNVLKQLGAKSHKNSKLKESRMWSPGDIQPQPSMTQFNKTFRKHSNRKSTTSKFIFNKIKQTPIERKPAESYKLSLNVESVQTTQFQQTSINSPMRRSFKEPWKKIRNSERLSLSKTLLNTRNLKEMGKVKKVNGNQSRIFHSLIEDSLNQFRTPHDSRVYKDLGQICESREIEEILVKFKQIHANSCKETSCTHLARFYQNLKKADNSVSARKSPMPIKTLKISQIDHS